MIVVDSNVIAYCWIHGEKSALAHRLRKLDPVWHAPVLWRSELRNILTGYRRDGSLDAAQVRQIMAAAEAALAGREHHLPTERVFAVTEKCRLSAYDAEFVALAQILQATLVTEDQAVLAAFPEIASSVEAALGIAGLGCVRRAIFSAVAEKSPRRSGASGGFGTSPRRVSAFPRRGRRTEFAARPHRPCGRILPRGGSGNQTSVW